MSEKLYGSCTLSIQFKNHGEYLKWLKYTGNDIGTRWDFVITYPAIFRAKYEFHTTLDVDIMAKKIIQLLQMGFDVHSANWQLKEYKSQLED